MSDLARDVARELDRRQRRRKLLLVVGLAGAAILAVLYLRCGGGWGIGRSGAGDGTGAGSGARNASAIVDGGPHRCAIRVASAGISVDGAAATRAQAIAACAKAGGADVLVTGDARQGDWDELHAALDGAHVPVFLRDHP